MKRLHLISLMLTFCMVFSASASAFLHIGEHQHDTHEHQHESHDVEAEHAHHFNLQVVGDLVELESFSLTRPVSLASEDYPSQLISRTYSPPIPPPNA